MSYSDKLKDPRWQKMRLEILERDGFACRKCEAKDKTLHVHHFYYTKGAAPWEYEPSALITLCEDCHGCVESAASEMKAVIGVMLTTPCLSIDTATGIMGCISRFLESARCAGEEFGNAEDFLNRCSMFSAYMHGVCVGMGRVSTRGEAPRKSETP